jgi:hypothetical protein
VEMLVENKPQTRGTQNPNCQTWSFFNQKLNFSSPFGEFSPVWLVTYKNREICKKPRARKLNSLILVKFYISCLDGSAHVEYTIFSGCQRHVTTYIKTFFETPLVTPSSSRFGVLTQVIRGKNEVM